MCASPAPRPSRYDLKACMYRAVRQYVATSPTIASPRSWTPSHGDSCVLSCALIPWHGTPLSHVMNTSVVVALHTFMRWAISCLDELLRATRERRGQCASARPVGEP